MSKYYWEKHNKNNCASKPIVSNDISNSGAIIVGRQLSDGLNEHERLKLVEIEDRAQVNIIESIEVNSKKQEISDDKTINIFVPTKLSQLENDSNYINNITTEQIKLAVDGKIPFISDFYITEDQWATLTWDSNVIEPEIPSEEPEVIEEGK